jgi:hypothetical protein
MALCEKFKRYKEMEADGWKEFEAGRILPNVRSFAKCAVRVGLPKIQATEVTQNTPGLSFHSL